MGKRGGRLLHASLYVEGSREIQHIDKKEALEVKAKE